MKSFRKVLFVFLIVVVAVSGLSAQSLKGMSFNGATGLYNVPSGRISWEKRANLGLDLGYHAIIVNDKANHIPKVNLSLFKWVELHGAFDIQPGDETNDFLIGGKIQLPTKNTAVAIGGNFQIINQGPIRGQHNAGQIYMAVTYPGTFFNMPAETSLVVGKSFMENQNNSNIDFGMGFDLILFPKTFQNVVHLVIDFSNFAYSTDARGALTGRGCLNTGLRIDLAAIPALSKFKFALDLVLTDAFDTSRAFGFGAVFGIPIM